MNKSRKTKSDGKVYSSSSMYVGMDVHKNYLQIAVLNEKGKVLNNSRVDNEVNKISEYFDRLNHGQFESILKWDFMVPIEYDCKPIKIRL
ncbi:MAG: hypothetical protein WBL44_01410 [Nitrososphaeraceae archaeon]